MSLNRNNFLRFNGTFLPLPYTITRGTDRVTLYSNEDYLICSPFTQGTLPTASAGINTYSLKIENILDGGGHEIELSSPCEWDGISVMKIYRPIDIAVTDFVVYYSFEDYLGNTISARSIVIVSVSTIFTSWVAYPTSSYCTLDSFGNNNGKLGWTQLKLINTTSGTDISPLTLKDNEISDPDYLAPITDVSTCPVVGIGDYAPLFIGNFSRNGADPSNYILITNIYLSSSNLGPGGTPINLNVSCAIPSGSTQRFNVPAILYDNGITIQYSVNGNMVTAPIQRYWKSNKAGFVDNFPTGGSHPVDNTGSYGNFTITVPATSDGVTIYAQ